MRLWTTVLMILAVADASLTKWYRRRLAQIKQPTKRGSSIGSKGYGSKYGARTKAASSMNKYRNSGRKPYARKPVPRLKIEQTKYQPTKPPAQVKHNPPAPTEFKGPAPEWVVIWQKGEYCHGNTGAAIPCQEPIRVGNSCKDKVAWSDKGWTEVEMYCYRNPKYPKLAIRREIVKQCFFMDGMYECWRHWSSNHLIDQRG